MNKQICLPSLKAKSNSLKALKVMKTLSLVTKEELKSASPLNVTYISNKKAKIVKCRKLSDASTDNEDN